MPKVSVRKGESLDNALKRFKRDVSKAGTLKEVRKREHYTKPGVERRIKSQEAQKKNKKRKN